MRGIRGVMSYKVDNIIYQERIFESFIVDLLVRLILRDMREANYQITETDAKKLVNLLADYNQKSHNLPHKAEHNQKKESKGSIQKVTRPNLLAEIMNWAFYLKFQGSSLDVQQIGQVAIEYVMHNAQKLKLKSRYNERKIWVLEPIEAK
jgi:hypothetical protein